MIATLTKAREDVARQLAGADPDRVTAAKAAELMTLFAEIERLGAAGKVLFDDIGADAHHLLHRYRQFEPS